jgi:hypothetical protein
MAWRKMAWRQWRRQNRKCAALIARSRVCGAHTHQRVSVAGAGERSAAHAMLRIGRTSASLRGAHQRARSGSTSNMRCGAYVAA